MEVSSDIKPLDTTTSSEPVEANLYKDVKALEKQLEFVELQE